MINRWNIILISICIWSLFFIFGVYLGQTSISCNICIINSEFLELNVVPYSLDIEYLLTNNIKSIVLNIGGVFIIGLPSISNLSLNGLIFGLIVETSQMNYKQIILFTLPHGIFELPALWLAGAAGLKGPQVFLRYLRGGEFVTREDVKEYLTLSALSVVLIVIAAWIEANITPKIAERFLQ